MTHFKVVATLVAGHSVSGCIYVPPVWDNLAYQNKMQGV